MVMAILVVALSSPGFLADLLWEEAFMKSAVMSIAMEKVLVEVMEDIIMVVAEVLAVEVMEDIIANTQDKHMPPLTPTWVAPHVQRRDPCKIQFFPEGRKTYILQGLDVENLVPNCVRISSCAIC
jgi:hypothetical protein